jgi:hypothetical protein
MAGQSPLSTPAWAADDLDDILASRREQGIDESVKDNLVQGIGCIATLAIGGLLLWGLAAVSDDVLAIATPVLFVVLVIGWAVWVRTRAAGL